MVVQLGLDLHQVEEDFVFGVGLLELHAGHECGPVVWLEPLSFVVVLFCVVVLWLPFLEQLRLGLDLG